MIQGLPAMISGVSKKVLVVFGNIQAFPGPILAYLG
jgi:hypothetical protein